MHVSLAFLIADAANVIARGILRGASEADTVAVVRVVELKQIPPADPKAIAALEQSLVHVEKSDPATELLWVDFAANAPKWTGTAK